MWLEGVSRANFFVYYILLRGKISYFINKIHINTASMLHTEQKYVSAATI